MIPEFYNDKASQDEADAVSVSSGHTSDLEDTVLGVVGGADSPFVTAPVPTISGSGLKGSTLTAHPGTWSPAPTETTYQWYRSGVAIPGASEPTYTLTASDASKVITVKVTGSRDGYVTTEQTSAGVVMANFFTTTPTPTISGTLRAGYTLTANTGTWSPNPATFTYRWYRYGVAITGAIHGAYTLTAADRGHDHHRQGHRVTQRLRDRRHAVCRQVRAQVSSPPRRFPRSPAPRRRATPSPRSTAGHPRPRTLPVVPQRRGDHRAPTAPRTSSPVPTRARRSP